MSSADKFFDDVNFVSVVDNIKNIYTSDGSMSVLLDFERVLEESDIYAFEDWDLGELVRGPVIDKYKVSCMFMWPRHKMPDPRACKRLLRLGCRVLWKKTKIKIPVQIEDYEDFEPGTRYPRMMPYKVWLVNIIMPRDIMNEIREGSIDLAGQKIDLSDLDDSYLEDLDKEEQQDGKKPGDEAAPGMPAPGLGMPPPPMGGGLPPPSGGGLPPL